MVVLCRGKMEKEQFEFGSVFSWQLLTYDLETHNDRTLELERLAEN